jgi:hypothetical protein
MFGFPMVRRPKKPSGLYLHPYLRAFCMETCMHKLHALHPYLRAFCSTHTCVRALTDISESHSVTIRKDSADMHAVHYQVTMTR